MKRFGVKLWWLPGTYGCAHGYRVEYSHNIRQQTHWLTLPGWLSSDPLERRVITKEYLSGAYPLSAYYLAKITTDFPTVLLYPGLIVLGSYFLTGLTVSGGNFFAFLFAFLLVTVVAQVSAGSFAEANGFEAYTVVFSGTTQNLNVDPQAVGTALGICIQNTRLLMQVLNFVFDYNNITGDVDFIVLFSLNQFLWHTWDCNASRLIQERGCFCFTCKLKPCDKRQLVEVTLCFCLCLGKLECSGSTSHPTSAGFATCPSLAMDWICSFRLRWHTDRLSSKNWDFLCLTFRRGKAYARILLLNFPNWHICSVWQLTVNGQWMWSQLRATVDSTVAPVTQTWELLFSDVRGPTKPYFMNVSAPTSVMSLGSRYLNRITTTSCSFFQSGLLSPFCWEHWCSSEFSDSSSCALWGTQKHLVHVSLSRIPAGINSQTWSLFCLQSRNWNAMNQIVWSGATFLWLVSCWSSNESDFIVCWFNFLTRRASKYFTHCRTHQINRKKTQTKLTTHVLWSNCSIQRSKLSFSLCFENLNAWIGKRQILKDVSGFVKHGTMMAIMGPSGNF